MNTDSIVLLVAVWIPLLVVSAVVIVDVIRRDDLGGRAKALWVLLCILVWPALIVYLLLRPPRGRLEVPDERDDPHARLVDAALLHEAGAISNADMDTIGRELRGR